MRLKREILSLLRQPDFEAAALDIGRFPARQAVNPLFSFFYSGDDLLRWRAVTAMGIVVAQLAGTDIESARVVMRRLVWNLNDESGGIGWGSPEAMGEITARNRKLAEEFGCLLVSYIHPQGNYLEHEILQRGVLWGLGRLAHAHPDLVSDAAPHLPPYLRSKDPCLRGLGAWVAGAVGGPGRRTLLAGLTDDQAVFKMFINGDLVQKSVASMALAALGPGAAGRM